MSEFRTFTFTLAANKGTQSRLAQHAGAARFAYNHCVAAHRAAVAARQKDPAVKVPRSGFDFINLFNAWKRSPAAGEAAQAEDGKPGLAWRSSVSQQVFEEACVDAGDAVRAYRKVKGRGAPRFKAKHRAPAHFRLRNKGGRMRVEDRSLVLPTLGAIKMRGDNDHLRNLRRLLSERPGIPPARLLFAAITRHAGRWSVSLHLECEAIDPRQQTRGAPDALVGIDLGLHAFAVIADADGHEHGREVAPKPLIRRARRVRRLCRRLSRHKKGSRRRARARAKLAREHHRIACIRNDMLHKLSTRLTKQYGQIALEDLNVAGMVRNHSLARHIQDSAWGTFARMVTYKGSWYGCTVHRVDRFAPTTKRCCRCDAVTPPLPLSQRVFTCPSCHATADRDTNAAANCARWVLHSSNRMVAGKHSETVNARGGPHRGPGFTARPPSAEEKREQP